MYLAEVPKSVIRSSSREVPQDRGRGDERRAVVEQQRRPDARPETSQFHIIQPQVVK